MIRARGIGLFGVLMGCALMTAVGCGSSSAKKRTNPGKGDAGAAGASEGGAAGSPEQPAGGQAGEAPTPGAAGEGGMAGEGGAAGSSGEGGEGGAAGSSTEPLACQPVGATPFVQIENDMTLKVCRGSRAVGTYSATASPASFVCCGAAVGQTPFAAALTAHGYGNLKVGFIDFVVPTEAPLGKQSLAVTCQDSVSPTTFNIDVVAGTPPVVTGLSPSTLDTEASGLTITGSNLGAVEAVVFVPTNGVGREWICTVIPSQSTASSVHCTLDGMVVGTYHVITSTGECGSAVNTPVLTVVPAT